MRFFPDFGKAFQSALEDQAVRDIIELLIVPLVADRTNTWLASYERVGRR